MGQQNVQGSSPHPLQRLMQQMAGAQHPQLGQLFSQMTGAPQQPPDLRQFWQQQGMPPRVSMGDAAPYMQRQSAKNPGAGSSGPSTAGYGGQGGAGASPPGLASALGAAGESPTRRPTRAALQQFAR